MDESTALNTYSLADPSGQIAPPTRHSNELSKNSHIVYLFNDTEEKQQKIFPLLERTLSKSTSVLYIAGKQGVKGIRLSLKDFGLDVAMYEREKKFRIVDSEEWYLSRSRQPAFKQPDEIVSEIKNFGSFSTSSGFECGTIISETDMLVRKGFFGRYLELERELLKLTESSPIALLCAYDERELEANGSKGRENEIFALHSSELSA
jgi:MEDS: MEthanogen/methylotroph, DcmR Sensory domain